VRDKIHLILAAYFFFFLGSWFDLFLVREQFRKEFKEKNPKNKSVAAVSF